MGEPDCPPERPRDLLVTLADRNYLEPAKQLFSSAYHNAGWRGDYLLLAHDLSAAETSWFLDRGILVRHCEPLFSAQVGGMPAVLASKLYVFGAEFRRWRTILYIDADATVRASLDGLIGLRGFHSVLDWNPILKLQVASRAELKRRGVSAEARAEAGRLLRRYEPYAPAFCAGFFVFGSDVLEDDLLRSLLESLRRLDPVSRFGDQLTLNLHFYRRWRCLSPVHHLMLRNGRPPWPLRSRDVDAVTLHFVGPTKPWHTRGVHHDEWSRNLARAEALDLKAIPEGVQWSPARLERQSRRLSNRLALGSLARRFRAVLHTGP